MKFFLDTEFIEDGKTIDLISIGIAAEDGRLFYAINQECDFRKANDWVRDNVLSKLEHPPALGNCYEEEIFSSEEVKRFEEYCRKVRKYRLLKAIGVESSDLDPRVEQAIGTTPLYLTKEAIASALYNFVLSPGLEPLLRGTKNQFITDCGAYDWVVMCQLFGGMSQLPPIFPHYFIDIRSTLDLLNIPYVPPQQGYQHHALSDAIYTKKVYEFIQGYPTKRMIYERLSLYDGFIR